MNINISAAQLRRAADIKDQIEALQTEFLGILHGDQPKPTPKPNTWTPERLAKFKRTMRLKRQGKL